MKVHQLLDHYGISENPFSQEDAQSDRIFQEYLLKGTRHAAWDKVLGDPKTPSTAVVFGEQGSGKTAMRLQLVNEIREHNRANPKTRSFIVEYDDFNPFLDAFRERLGAWQRKPEKALQSWRLWDHMDAILSLILTRLTNAIRNDGKDIKDESHSISIEALQQMPRPQKRDLLLMAAVYDNDRDLAAIPRFDKLKSKVKFMSIGRYWSLLIGVVLSIVSVGVIYKLGEGWGGFSTYKWPWLIAAVGWAPFLYHQFRLFWQAWRISRQVRIVEHSVGTLRKKLASFNLAEYLGQPIPSKARSDDRYEMILKLQNVLVSLGFTSITVLVDRVDEPHLINGAADRMRDLIWPLFDNKFLKHPGIAFKLLLPAALSTYLNRQEREFYERSRLDKQNLIPSLNWSGQALYDIANDRIKACAKLAEGKKPGIRDLFDPAITDGELITMFERLRAPRHLFKFLYRLLVDHCGKYTEDQPVWKIRPETLQSSLSLFMRDLDAYDRKLGTG
jgi:hypothetical protein